MTKAFIGLGVLLLMVAALGLAAHTEPATPSITRAQLIGAWQLVGIDYSSSTDSKADPFYQEGSIGTLIYDASGAMSVQISAPHRAGVTGAVPESRTTPATGRAAHDKALAYDTYYAYFGTWNFDAARGVMTHHVQAALIPAEIGKVYTQSVTLSDHRMLFTNRDAHTVRTKLWQRLEATH